MPLKALELKHHVGFSPKKPCELADQAPIQKLTSQAASQLNAQALVLATVACWQPQSGCPGCLGSPGYWLPV